LFSLPTPPVRQPKDIQRFLLRLLGFLGIMAVLVGGLFIGTGWLYRSVQPLALPADVHSVVMGHSHTECSFVDSLAPGYVNLAQSGESYFYSYQKLKGLVADNPHLETVFLEFTNNQIDVGMDDWIWSNKYLEYRMPMYAAYLSWKDHLVLVRRNPACFMAAGIASIKENIVKRLEGGGAPTKTFGGYLGLEKALGSDTARFEAVGLGKSDVASEISETNLVYLKRIHELCEVRNIQLVFLRSPQHKTYVLTNEAQYQGIREERFGSIPYYDFGRMALPDSLFADLEHLNAAGSRTFTRRFLDHLETANELAYR
jgi:hypothetical protein